MKGHLIIVMLTSLLAFGCQSQPAVKQGAADNSSFMTLWTTYSHCQNTEDFDLLRQDATALGAAAKRSLSGEGFVLPLPAKLQQYVTPPGTRYAVDVKAMSAACSLRAGQAAVETHRFDIAEELLQEILAYHPKSEYAFYSLQAKAMLSAIPVSVQVTLKRP